MDYCKYEDHLNYAENSEWLMYYGRLALELFTNCKTLNYSNAIHEAGHAALNECLGYKVKSVGIYPQKVTEIEPVTKQDAEHVVIIAHAGYVAAIQVIDKYHAFQFANEDRFLMHQIYETKKWTPKQINEIYKKCEELVGQNWKQIEAVANKLVDKKMLTGDEVREIISRQ
jgi:hypothetical protein